MNTNKIISSEKVILDTPPDINSLKKYSADELITECNRLGVPRELMEASNDDDKNINFMISEILRLNPPVPKPQKPTLLKSEYDSVTMKKTNTLKYVKHIMNNEKYEHSIITQESYKLPLTQKELDDQTKENLLNSIQEEISQLNLDEYKNKEDILKFACENGKSSGEKYRRASLLSQSVIKHMITDNKYIRPRITHFDISVY